MTTTKRAAKAQKTKAKRAPVIASAARGKLLRVRVSAAEESAMLSAAERDHLTLSAWARQHLLRAAAVGAP